MTLGNIRKNKNYNINIALMIGRYRIQIDKKIGRFENEERIDKVIKG